jgi:peroxin-10
MDRHHPAAPSSCGHVFCWNCLMQWVSTVRPQCPLCRAPCRPQDVLPLYNYEQQPLAANNHNAQK